MLERLVFLALMRSGRFHVRIDCGLQSLLESKEQKKTIPDCFLGNFEGDRLGTGIDSRLSHWPTRWLERRARILCHRRFLLHEVHI
jgi:hypothetical protein